MSDIDQIQKDIKGLEREIIETRSLNIKTSNNLSSLFAELKKIAENQKKAEKKARLGNISVYVIFVVVVATFAILLSNMRASVLEKQIDEYKQEAEKAHQQLNSVKLEMEARDAAQKSAFQLFKLIKENKMEQAVKEFKKLDQTKLTPTEIAMLENRIGEFKKELAKEHYSQGIQQYKIGGNKSAINEFKTSLEFYKEPDYLGLLLYYLGKACLKDEQIDEGIKYLKAAAKTDLVQHMADQARLLVADTLMDEKRYKEALDYLNSIDPKDVGYYPKQDIAQKIKNAKYLLAIQKRKEKNGANE